MPKNSFVAEVTFKFKMHHQNTNYALFSKITVNSIFFNLNTSQDH